MPTNAGFDPVAPLLLRRCAEGELDSILEIVNAAAEAYRRFVPDDRWHDPYMSASELDRELRSGVVFWCAERCGEIVGVMGLQPVLDVELIRHAYVRPQRQGTGVGGALLDDLVARARKPLLVGTWADATWAIRFYERHGFRLEEDPARRVALLRRYWDVPDAQIAASVVMELPVSAAAATRRDED